MTPLKPAESNVKEEFNFPINYQKTSYLLFRNDPNLYPYYSILIVLRCDEFIPSCVYFMAVS